MRLAALLSRAVGAVDRYQAVVALVSDLAPWPQNLDKVKSEEIWLSSKSAREKRKH
jgi:hypothetical protein